MTIFRLIVSLGTLCFPFSGFSDERPHEAKTLKPGVTLSLVVEHPDVATPTGIDVDREGGVWVVACHTHQPKDDYKGPKKDRILHFDKDGKRSVFYDQTYHTMDLELGPDGWVYLAERGRIFRIKDSDADGKADLVEDLINLSTEADYPHNALSGLAFHPITGELHFGLGENFAKHWILEAKDGSKYEGIGRGGAFRCKPDGTKLHRIARGLWNPFGMLVRSDGEIFASDNDPGERPPCRLIHIVEGGDYGYQRLYGGEAHHPFVCWNGELRGTLPMVHLSSEAPCGIVELGRGVIIPSWSDHRIDFYPLTPKGASYSADRIQLVGGSKYFRPTCIAPAPSNDKNTAVKTWYFADWVDGSYPVHGFGRVWKLEIDLKRAKEWTGPLEIPALNEEAKAAASLRNGETKLSKTELLKLTQNEDPFMAEAALFALSKQADWSVDDFRNLPAADRIQALLALKWSDAPHKKWIPALLDDKDPEVLFETLRWISDSQLKAYLPSVEAILKRNDPGFKLFEAAMAAKNMLEGKPEFGAHVPEILFSRILDDSSSPKLRAYALRLLPAKLKRMSKNLGVKEFRKLLALKNTELSMEVVRVLSGNDLLIEIAKDQTNSKEIRTEAVAGFGLLADSQIPFLVETAGSPEVSLREEALRMLRSSSLSDGQNHQLRSSMKKFPDSVELFQTILEPVKLNENRPALTDTKAWMARLDAVKTPSDIDAGRRIFHNTRIALCGNCHRNDGRGNVVGPDLSRVGDRGDRDWLLMSILNPNEEIAPQYMPRILKLKDGTSFVGIRLRSSNSEVLRDIEGKNKGFKLDLIESIHELPNSFMPAGLPMSLTDRELRDLLAFLNR